MVVVVVVVEVVVLAFEVVVEVSVVVSLVTGLVVVGGCRGVVCALVGVDAFCWFASGVGLGLVVSVRAMVAAAKAAVVRSRRSLSRRW